MSYKLLFGDIVSRLRFDEIDIDNWVFKFYSKLTVFLFWGAAACAVANSYTGKDIECKGGSGYDDHYCWLHGVEHLKPGQITNTIMNGHDCISTDHFADQEEKRMTYYLWVSLVLFLCGAVFAIPNEIWKHFEGGFLKQFGDNRYNFLKEENRENAAKQYHNFSKNATNRYFFIFLIIEFSHFVLGNIVFRLLDTFIDGKFVSYGSDTIAYLRDQSNSVEVHTDDATYELKVNPMCNVFPTVAACSVSTFGVNGEEDIKSNICIMGQNIMNQKIFLVLWIWFMVLFAVSGCQIIYRLATLLIPGLQTRAIQSYMRSKDDAAVKELKLGFDYIGNWFVLTQIGSNSNPYAFRIFMEDITGITRKRDEQKEKTKKQKLKEKNSKEEVKEEKLKGGDEVINIEK